MSTSSSREKQPFSACIQAVNQDHLSAPLCRELYGDLVVQDQFKWIISAIVQQPTIQIHFFSASLDLSEEETKAVIRVAPRSKEEQLRQAIFAWSKLRGGEATVEKLLEALYIGDEVELVESICQSESIDEVDGCVCSFNVGLFYENQIFSQEASVMTARLTQLFPSPPS